MLALVAEARGMCLPLRFAINCLSCRRYLVSSEYLNSEPLLRIIKVSTNNASSASSTSACYRESYLWWQVYVQHSGWSFNSTRALSIRWIFRRLLLGFCATIVHGWEALGSPSDKESHNGTMYHQTTIKNIVPCGVFLSTLCMVTPFWNMISLIACRMTPSLSFSEWLSRAGSNAYAMIW